MEEYISAIMESSLTEREQLHLLELVKESEDPLSNRNMAHTVGRSVAIGYGVKGAASGVRLALIKNKYKKKEIQLEAIRKQMEYAESDEDLKKMKEKEKDLVAELYVLRNDKLSAEKNLRKEGTAAAVGAATALLTKEKKKKDDNKSKRDDEPIDVEWKEVKESANDILSEVLELIDNI